MAIDTKKEETAPEERRIRTPLPKEGGQDSSRSMLLERAKNGADEGQRQEAVSSLAGDLEALKEVVKESPHRDSRNASAELLLADDASVVELLSSDNKNASSAILEKLMRNPESLLGIAKSCMNAAARGIALEKVKDAAHLVDIAKYSIFSDSRSAALEKLGGGIESIEEVAASSSYRDTRLAALEMIKEDGEALARVEAKSLYEDTRNDAHAIPELKRRS